MDVAGFLDLQTLLVALVVFLLIGRFLQTPRNLPPGPWGFPVLGVLPRLLSDRRIHLRFWAWSRQYGDVISCSFGQRYLVVLNSVDAIKEAFVQHADAFSDRPNFLYMLEKVTGKKGVIAQNGDDWKQLRRFTLVTLRDMGVGKSTLEERIREEASCVVNELEKQIGRSYDIRTVFSNAVSNVICSVVFGSRFEYDDEEFQYYLKSINFMVSRGSLNVPENFFPFLRHFNLSPLKEVFKKNSELQDFIRQKIKEHESTFDGVTVRDFIDLYIQTARGSSTDVHSAINDENIFRVILDLFVAGSETTSTTLQWLIIYLILNPDKQTKCRQHILKVIGSGRLPKLSDRSDLPYIEATINEVQRIASITPVGVARSTSRAVRFRGYTLPEQTIVLANLFAIHHSERYWTDPYEFRPERWLDNNNMLIKHEAFMPFSTGKRVCLGESLARMELFLFSTTLLQRFEFTSGDAIPTLDVTAGITLSPLPFSVRVKK